ncbi:MAG: cohesin domain-containing protein [Bacteroidales bacterium]
MKKVVFILLCSVLLASARLLAADAPVTTAGTVTNAVPGAPSVQIPVTVAGFANIGQFTLTMTFDTTIVRYVSCNITPLLPGMSVTYYSPIVNTQGKLIFTWTGATNLSLTDGASIVNLTFSYVAGTGLLNWADASGSVCQYKRYITGVLTELNDAPQYLFYKNGGISNRGAPVTSAPTVTVTGTGPVAVPITVSGFTGIGALTLNLEYDPAIMTYVNFTKNAAFGSSFLVGSIAGTGGKKLMVIQWYGNAVTLGAGATLCTLNFSYIAANGNGTTLLWFDNGPSCQYTDGSGAVLIDLPKNTYLHDGLVSPPIAGVSVSPSANPVCAGTVVSFTAIPANGGSTPAYQWKVNGINTGTNSVTFSYIPANNDQVTCVMTSSLTFVAGNPATSAPVNMSVNSLPVSITISASSNPVCQGMAVNLSAVAVNGGSLPVYQWMVNAIGAGTNSPDFTYIPADNDVVTCQVTSDAACTTGNPALSNQVVIDVVSLPVVVTDFSANMLTPRRSDTVLLTDLSTGGATSWTWSFDKPGVVFLNETSAQSQNPQVKFTEGGLYSVTLLAANICFNDSELKSGYIRAGSHGLWTGSSSEDWNSAANWDDDLVPDSNTDVVIPPGAANWPLFDGNLILGFHCKNLTLSGVTSQMTITGDITIP